VKAARRALSWAECVNAVAVRILHSQDQYQCSSLLPPSSPAFSPLLAAIAAARPCRLPATVERTNASCLRFTIPLLNCMLQLYQVPCVQSIAKVEPPPPSRPGVASCCKRKSDALILTMHARNQCIHELSKRNPCMKTMLGRRIHACKLRVPIRYLAHNSDTCLPFLAYFSNGAYECKPPAGSPDLIRILCRPLANVPKRTPCMGNNRLQTAWNVNTKPPIVPL
jgi:hypothetical protein